MKVFKIHPSACGHIMTNDRSGKNMGETAKTYCEIWLKEQLYGRRKEFTNKYAEKGNIVEDNSLDFIADKLGLGLLIKNQQVYENEFMIGTPDVVLKDYLIDVKNSWDCFTLPIFDETVTNRDYIYQAQCYMNLTGVKRFKLIYVLSDTPMHLIEKEAYWYAKNNGYDELDQEMFDQFIAKMTFLDVPDSLKMKVFHIDYDPQMVEAIQNRVIQCREYIETLKY